MKPAQLAQLREEGRQAFHHGVSLHDCPHQWDSRQAWRDGWISAQHEAEDAGIRGSAWTKIPHTQWPQRCPRCARGLSNTSFEPYCPYLDCLWNNEENL